MSTRTIHFEAVTTRREKSGRCPVCGRKVRRARTFEQTINPFHTVLEPLLKAEGSIPQDEARELVRESVEAAADRWFPDFTHAACAAAGGAR